jgi:hypothetical protein
LLRGVEASGWDEADIPLHCPMKMGLIYIWLYMYRYNIVIVIIFYLLNLLYYIFIFTYIYIYMVYMYLYICIHGRYPLPGGAVVPWDISTAVYPCLKVSQWTSTFTFHVVVLLWTGL